MSEPEKQKAGVGRVSRRPVVPHTVIAFCGAFVLQDVVPKTIIDNVQLCNALDNTLKKAAKLLPGQSLISSLYPLGPTR